MGAGRFIAFEGGEGAGKSTHASRLVARLDDAVLTREPGGTPAGRAIRDLFLDPETGGLDARTEALLMAADRAQHAAEVIRPALDAGRWVVTDRYLYSSVAYQGHGRDLDPAWVRDLSLWATGDLEPDVVVFLDLSVDAAAERLSNRSHDRMEREDRAFHASVRDGFAAQAAADPDRWVVVDADRDREMVWSDVWDGIAARVDLPPS